MKHRLIRWFQKNTFPVENSFEPQKKPRKTILENGCILYNDVEYAKQYPNSFMDIYVWPDSAETGRYTCFYIHGGGYTWGDKVELDPNAKGADDPKWFFHSILAAGYNIVSINYALAPEYKYPVPIMQAVQAAEYLCKNGALYGIDTEKLFGSGGSAGGQLIGQFANMVTNQSYRREMGMEIPLKEESFKAMVFSSALLDNERYDRTDNFVLNLLFLKCGRAYFEVKKLQGDAAVIQSNVIENATKNFPPTFISDGNSGSFTDQNIEFGEKLKRLEVPCEVNIYPKEERKLTHGFEAVQNKYGVDNMKHILAFLEEYLV